MSFVLDRNITEPVGDYLAGKAQINAGQNIRHDLNPGFRLEFVDFDRGVIGQEPYYDGTDEGAISFRHNRAF
jgi:hypothetical protein